MIIVKLKIKNLKFFNQHSSSSFISKKKPPKLLIRILRVLKRKKITKIELDQEENSWFANLLGTSFSIRGKNSQNWANLNKPWNNSN